MRPTRAAVHQAGVSKVTAALQQCNLFEVAHLPHSPVSLAIQRKGSSADLWTPLATRCASAFRPQTQTCSFSGLKSCHGVPVICVLLDPFLTWFFDGTLLARMRSGRLEVVKGGKWDACSYRCSDGTTTKPLWLRCWTALEDPSFLRMSFDELRRRPPPQQTCTRQPRNGLSSVLSAAGIPVTCPSFGPMTWRDGDKTAPIRVAMTKARHSRVEYKRYGHWVGWTTEDTQTGDGVDLLVVETGEHVYAIPTIALLNHTGVSRKGFLLYPPGTPVGTRGPKRGEMWAEEYRIDVGEKEHATRQLRRIFEMVKWRGCDA
ncbi:unnamed protein product [Vitrella brassicaformis CCMP3155]|uniref:Uncharacterized protein n=2 Tax=Vitrella brassicaformis TaxID=1169539 RepID=A0A0G4EUY7_VITBC|nr:unnamed protein product [Vitrella brassicaformis CCMP3155]|eukprot:CEM02064.1 unnamed protein product [Vitrella brassicaformis CCMP3155]